MAVSQTKTSKKEKKFKKKNTKINLTPQQNNCSPHPSEKLNISPARYDSIKNKKYHTIYYTTCDVYNLYNLNYCDCICYTKTKRDKKANRKQNKTIRQIVRFFTLTIVIDSWDLLACFCHFPPKKKKKSYPIDVSFISFSINPVWKKKQTDTNKRFTHMTILLCILIFTWSLNHLSKILNSALLPFRLHFVTAIEKNKNKTKMIDTAIFNF